MEIGWIGFIVIFSIIGVFLLLYVFLFVKCIDMGPVATDPIPDYILNSVKEVK